MRMRYAIVPSEWISHGVPDVDRDGTVLGTGAPIFSTSEEAWAVIEATIVKLESTVPKTGDGADYLACQIAHWQGMTVAQISGLRRRTYDEAKSLHAKLPQFYPAP